MAQPAEKPVLYLAFDVETTGPSASVHSMIAFAVVCFDKDRKQEVYSYRANIKERRDRSRNGDCMKFWAKFPEQFMACFRDAVEPSVFCDQLAAKLREWQQEYALEWVAGPACFDFAWLSNYWQLFAREEDLDLVKAYKCRDLTEAEESVKTKSSLTDVDLAKLYADAGIVNKEPHNPEEDARFQGVQWLAVQGYLRT